MTDITELYAPQFEQFGIALSSAGAVYTGAVANSRASGRAWIMPIDANCLVMEHFITPAHDMQLAEYTPEPYACVSEISLPTLECMPAAGITPANLKPSRGPWPARQICSFIQDNCGVELSPLFAGKLYHSRSIIFLPGYFDELERSYPGEFSGAFEAFAEVWDEEPAQAIARALASLSERRAQTAGAHLYMRGVVESMAGELARARGAKSAAEAARDTRGARELAEEAARLVERALEEGRRPRLEELAAHLYVSRSKLCATFKAQTGESLGAYVRRRRLERAQDLLGNSDLAVAEIARRLGYPHAAAFSTAFKQQTGLAPTQWRSNR